MLITAYSDKTFEYVSILANYDDRNFLIGWWTFLCLAGSQGMHHVLVQVMRTPPTTYFIKKAMGLDGASQRPGHQSAGTISAKHIYEIAKVKQQDRQHIPLPSICKSIVGTCKSMGIAVVGRMEQAA